MRSLGTPGWAQFFSFVPSKNCNFASMHRRYRHGVGRGMAIAPNPTQGPAGKTSMAVHCFETWQRWLVGVCHGRLTETAFFPVQKAAGCRIHACPRLCLPPPELVSSRPWTCHQSLLWELFLEPSGLLPCVAGRRGDVYAHLHALPAHLSSWWPACHPSVTPVSHGSSPSPSSAPWSVALGHSRGR